MQLGNSAQLGFSGLPVMLFHHKRLPLLEQPGQKPLRSRNAAGERGACVFRSQHEVDALPHAFGNLFRRTKSIRIVQDIVQNLIVRRLLHCMRYLTTLTRLRNT